MKNSVRLFLNNYGTQFRQMRKNAGFTQDEVANIIMCSQAIISHIECGYMLPPPHIEQALCNLYNIEVK